MRLRSAISSAAWLAIVAAAAGVASVTAPSDPTAVKQIAIIGAGAAGSSAAYHLSLFAETDNLPVNITIFERTNHIGGRALTVNVYDDPALPVELGASVFVPLNKILTDAVRDFGLELGGYNGDRLMMIWDGDQFVFESDSSTVWWWELGKLVWRYGLSTIRLKRIRDSTANAFLNLYDAPLFPFRSLTAAVRDIGLDSATSITGEQMLSDANVGKDFAKDIVQAATRVNYASNLGYIHGVETMVSMAAEGAMSVRGGNWQIFSTMLERCNTTCTVLTDTTVSFISLATKTKDNTDSSAKYILSTGSASSDTDNADYPVAFDSVIIATPWQYADITAVGLWDQPIEKIKYTHLHVTMFASSVRLSSTYFGLAPGANIPTSVLTTLTPEGDDKPEFISVSTVGGFRNPKTGVDEWAYKIFSRQEVTPEFLSRLLGVSIPKDFVGGDDGPISWYYPHVFNSYPILETRTTFQDPVLAEGLYYTSGIESFISTMETSTLMGKNVARLVLDDLLVKQVTVSRGHVVDLGDDQEQHILGINVKKDLK